MTTQNQTTTSPETAPASEPPRRDATRPTHRFWLVQGEGKDARWTELCALWPTKNGKGLYASMRTILPLIPQRQAGPPRRSPGYLQGSRSRNRRRAMVTLR